MPDINKIFKKFTSILKRELVILWIFSIVAGFALIVLQNKNKLPLGAGDFAFLSILALLVALWRPRWMFFLFVAAAGLENVILAGGFLPVQLRPYQFLGAVLVVAIAVLFASKHLKMKILKPVWLDWAILTLAPLSLLPLVYAPDKSIVLKNNLVLLSFVVLYFLARNFLRSKSDLIKTFFFFIGSYFIVAIFGFYQVLADKFLAYRQAGGAKSFEVMFGRPNSTFTEPDWLGIFLCFSLAVLFSILFYCRFERLPAGRQEAEVRSPRLVEMTMMIIYLLIFSNITLLILTLSRSAWIGAGTILFFYVFLSAPSIRKSSIADFRIQAWQRFFREGLLIFSIFALSIVFVEFGKLSKFDIFDRARSTATSEQKITIACESGANIPQTIAGVEELIKYNCRHINLEEIEAQKSQGKIVAEIFRQDPNVMTRGQIYKKSWKIIKTHPVLGVGFGTITQKLGADERGAGLNESNIFLQIWAGSGILGLIAFIVLLVYLFIYGFRRVSPVCPMNKFIGCPVVKDNFEKTLNIFLVLELLALIVPNLFNAGLFMGIFWLGLAIILSIPKINSH